ncbi:MAG: D-alanine--D-alanine ligase [Candidatus Abyssobacteria bacterium SURF_5]|uniref:D-alanine--D-alanine ligase n=1 Tax=Abyssobacteria bacterium (strain SURF_5) TaxID=2093360 RepID=A0A3A4NSL5_ABYX5|nr:MAG: D-alanine--D-alanine ligase [Candidatus Abyssubacteria bacterium SURF_5]
MWPSQNERNSRVGDRKINVAVVMGGRTAEHDVSIQSGTMVIRNLNLSRYNVKPITITRDGAWLIPQGYLSDGMPVAELLPEYLKHDSTGNELVPLETGSALSRTASEKVDVVFLAMHGPYGEDGTIQGLLEVLDLPYTGSNVEASAISMNKIRCKEIYIHHRIPTPRYLVFDEQDWPKKRMRLLEKVERRLGFPCVTKPPRLGSSVGIKIASDRNSFIEAVDLVLKYDNEVLIEQFIAGREITSPILGNRPGKKPTALPLVEIVPKSSTYFDYEAKYAPGGSDEITPARIDEKLTKKAQQLGIKAHRALGCGGLSRTDMILNGQSLYVLETNTIPGLTEASLFPKAARAAGMSLSQLCDHLIDIALITYKTKKICTDR